MLLLNNRFANSISPDLKCHLLSSFLLTISLYNIKSSGKSRSVCVSYAWIRILKACNILSGYSTHQIILYCALNCFLLCWVLLMCFLHMNRLLKEIELLGMPWHQGDKLFLTTFMTMMMLELVFKGNLLHSLSGYQLALTTDSIYGILCRRLK